MPEVTELIVAWIVIVPAPDAPSTVNVKSVGVVPNAFDCGLFKYDTVVPLGLAENVPTVTVAIGLVIEPTPLLKT